VFATQSAAAEFLAFVFFTTVFLVTGMDSLFYRRCVALRSSASLFASFFCAADKMC
jgi:hypothetical protein